jgi:prepilin-type N-terminal cleavage/methylation domain-containing protein
MTVHHMPVRNRKAFTLVELLVVIGVIGILIGLMLLAVRRSGGAARRTDCSNRLRQIAMSIHNYQDAYKHIPPTAGHFDHLGRFVASADGETSLLVGLMPFMELNPILDEINTAAEYDGIKYPAMTVSPADANYPVWQKRIPHFECPNTRPPKSTFGGTNFVFSIGDTARDLYGTRPSRGALSTTQTTTLEGISDGTSNTLMMFEVCRDKSKPTRWKIVNNNGTQFLDDVSRLDRLYDNPKKTGFAPSVQFTANQRGHSWADGMAGATLGNTILPPNGLNCSVNSQRKSDGIFSAGSTHTGGINAAHADGSCHFYTETIDIGVANAGTLTTEQLKDSAGIPSLHGVWGALGSANGNDLGNDL